MTEIITLGIKEKLLDEIFSACFCRRITGTNATIDGKLGILRITVRITLERIDSERSSLGSLTIEKAVTSLERKVASTSLVSLVVAAAINSLLAG